MKETNLTNGANVEIENEIINIQKNEEMNQIKEKANVANVMTQNVGEVMALSELNEQGVKVAKLEGNRTLNEKVTKAKMESLKKYGQLIPAIVVNASVARAQGLKVVDFSTDEEVTDETEAEYIVLLDANHRYQAHLNLKGQEEYTQDFFLIYALNDKVAVSKALAEINIATNPWKGADFAKGARMMVKEEAPTLEFITELTNQGFSLDAASKVALFSGKVNKNILSKAINGEVDEVLKATNGLERGRKILKAAKNSFGIDFLKNRTWIDWVISKYDKTPDEEKGNFTTEMVTFLSSIKRDDADTIEKAKGKRGEKTKETVVNDELNKLWEKRQVA